MRIRQPSGALALIVLAVTILAGCAGGGDSSGAPGPTVPPPSTPVSIAVQAGDNQSAEPGLMLPARPAVIVRDAGGRGVSHVSVTFAVDSGGGAIAGAQALTGADGVATAGDWTLGPSEGRNVLLVTAAGLTPLRVAAVAGYTGVTVSAGAVGASGGKLTLNRPGSALDRLEIEVQGGVLPGPVSFNVAATSSAGLRLSNGPAAGSARFRLTRPAAAVSAPAGLIAVTPIITFASDGPHTAAGEVLLRIPLPKGVGFDVVVAVVDSAGTPLAFLPAIAIDAVSVTVATRGLDQDIYAQIIPSSTPRTRTLSVVVFATGTGPVTLTEWLPDVVTANFTLGRDEFEFADIGTGLANEIDVGMALAEASSNVIPGGIHNVFQRAAGIPASNTRGLMLSAGLSQSYYRQLGEYGPQWIKSYETAYTPAVYHRLTLTAVYWHLKQIHTPAKLLLTDGLHSRMVLVLGWSSSSQTLTIRDPSQLGTGTLRFSSEGVLQPYSLPRAPGIVYTTPYFNNSLTYAMWPEIAKGLSEIMSAPAPEPYSSAWPKYSYLSWDPIVNSSSDRTVPDTLFMVGDTTRIWPLVLQSNFPVPSSLPTHGWNLQSAFFNTRSANGQWSAASTSYGSSLFIDARPGVNSNPWAQLTLGMTALRHENANGSAYTWMGWRQIDVVKYAVNVADVKEKPRVPVTLSATSPGGPVLPASATFEWNFNDQSPLVRVTGNVPVTHTFALSGTYAVDLRIYRAGGGELMAKVRATATIADSAVFYIPQDTIEALIGSQVTLTVKNRNAPTPKPIRYEWTFYHRQGQLIVPQSLSVEGDSVVQHTWNEVGTFATTVTVRDSLTNTILGRDTVQVNIGMTAWKFTSLNVLFFTFETVAGAGSRADHTICYTCWKTDSLMLERIKNHQNEGGLLFLDKEYVFPGFGFGAIQAMRGIYLLEGTDITEDRLQTAFDFTSEAFSSSPPAAGRIKNHWLAYANNTNRQGPTTDGNYLVSYSESGSLTNGSITGTTWGPSQPFNGNTIFFPLNVRQANVVFNGTEASGTLTYTYRIFEGGTGAPSRETWRIVGTLVFTAQRVR